VVELALLEDIGTGDITGDAVVPASARGAGEFVCRQQGVLAGMEVAGLVFQHCDPEIVLAPLVADGSEVDAGSSIARIDGNAQAILRGERTALNFLQRMSGIATLTARYVRAVRGTRAKITDTRKTAPGLRVLDKWAVRVGGGVNHRFGLDDMMLIKDNHIVAAGGVAAAIERGRKYLRACGIAAAMEVETTTLEQVREVLQSGGVQRIMLDNFPLSEMQKAVALVAGRAEVEASGGVTLDGVRAIAETGVDFISVGALTHSVRALDIALEFSHAGGG